MIRSTKAVLMLGGCALFGLAYAAWTAGSVALAEPVVAGARAEDSDDDDDDARNILALHDRSSRQYNKECTSCHRQVLSEQSSNPQIHTAHVAMNAFVPGKETNHKCAFCHRTTDLLLGSTGNVRRHVDVTLCAVCHGNYPERPTRHFYLTGPSPDRPDGPLLYSLMCSGCHGSLATSEVRGESAAEIRKEIAENEGGMGPLRILTTGEIDAIALALRR